MSFSSRIRNFPFSPSKIPFFYGWFILAFGTIGVLMSSPGQTIGVSVFTDHLIDALNLTRSQLSFSYMLGTGISAFFITFVGIFYDKYGARLVAIISTIGLSVVLVLLSKVDNIVLRAQELFASNDTLISTMVTITLLFFLLRFFGQGILTMVSRNMVMKWFNKRRGLANSILGVVTSFGFSVAPKIFKNLIDNSDWRSAWITLALIIGVFFTAIVIIFYRDNPEEFGMIPDGKIFKTGVKSKKDGVQKNYTQREAIKTYSFWIFNFALTLHALYGTAYTFQIESIFEVSGYDKALAVDIFLPAAIIAVITQFITSWLSDFVKLKYLLMFFLVGMVVSTTSLLFLKDQGISYNFFIVGNGIISGLFVTLVAVTWPRFFGTKHLGAISGFSMSWIVAGSAVGPYLFSLSLKNTGNYNLAAILCGGIAILLFVLSFWANNVSQSE